MKLPLLGSPSSAALTTTTTMPHVSASGDTAVASRQPSVETTSSSTAV
jgi:hypothetical protein